MAVADTPDPVSYSSFDGNVTFLRYRATVTNRSQGGTLAHTRLTEALPAGTTCVSATTTKGTAACASATEATATIGQLKKGQSAVVDVEVTAPASSDENPPPSTITNNVTAAFADNNPNDPGKDVTASYAETTTVTKDAGQTYCPAGEPCQVDTDPSALQYANVFVPNPTTDLIVKLNVLPPDGFCLLGQVTIQGNIYVCRNGGFVQAAVTDAETGAEYRDTANPLVFHLRWERPLISLLQNADNFVVFYRQQLSGPTQVFSARCNAGATNAPCLRNVTEEADGAWSVDLVKPDNGHMR